MNSFNLFRIVLKNYACPNDKLATKIQLKSYTMNFSSSTGDGVLHGEFLT